MPVTVHPPQTMTEAEDLTVESGSDWRAGGMGSLQIVDDQTVVVAEFAAGQWGWVEKA